MRKKKLTRKVSKQKIEPKKKIHVKKIVLPVVIFLLAIGVFLLLRNSRYFNLESVEVIDRMRATDLRADELRGTYKDRNIFDIDISSLSYRIESEYPSIKKAVVRRVLPNTLEVEILGRTPIAKIKARGYYPIDKTGMILSPDIKSGKLPIIMGFSMWLSPEVGKRLENKQLERAILLIEALEETAVGSDYDASTINVGNSRNLSFYLENGIMVKIGREDFSARLRNLRKILSDPGIDKENIKYIDLRFEDVVIGPK